MSGIFFEVPVDELTTPKEDHEILADKWWATRNGHPVGFKRTPKARAIYPQCNANKEIAERVAKHLQLDPPMFIPQAYWPISE